MPDRIRLPALIANALFCLIFGVFVPFALGQGRPGLAVFFALIAGLCGFNLYVANKAATLLSEEEWLRGELRTSQAVGGPTGGGRRRSHAVATPGP